MECINPGHNDKKVDADTIPEWAYDDRWCPECRAILKKVHMIQEHMKKHGNEAWDGVEKFRLKHGHLPSESAAPCKECFNERTVNIIRVRELESENAALKAKVERLRNLLDKASNADKYDWNMGLRDEVEQALKETE